MVTKASQFLLKALSSVDFDQAAKKLKGIPWRAVGVAVGGSFLFANLVSVYSASLLFPDQTQTPKSSRAPFSPRQELANLGSQPTLTKDAIDTILKRNIFNQTGELGDGADNLDKKRAGDSTQAVKTSLPLKLLGVIFGGTPYNGLATVQDDGKNKVDSYIVGDSIGGNVKILEIYPERIIIDNGGAREYVELTPFELVRSTRKKGGRPSSDSASAPLVAGGGISDSFKEEGFERKGSSIQITDSYKRDLLGPKMSKVLQDAKAVPNMVNGELKGFRLERIRDDSIYLKAGLQNGDIIEEINGTPLKDAAGAIRLLQSLRNEKQIEVRVNRNNSSFNMLISVQ